MSRLIDTRRNVRPSGVEAYFDLDEIIVTKTDPRGILTYANEIFVRMSGYTEQELIGQPHNVIRHPDMPRAIFEVLWSHLKAGREVFAYVVNLAADGSHYWVFAHVTPSVTPDGTVLGYHSNRRVPDRGAVREVTALYARLRATEQRQPDARSALEASSAELSALLAAQGMDYDAWVWSITPSETSDTETHGRAA